MAHPSESRAARQLKQVRNSVDIWRRTRQKLAPMPEELWTQATELAHRLGVWPVARDLSLAYESLKQRVEAKNRRKQAKTTRFVEIRGTDLLGVSDSDGTVVELCAPDGTRMTVRLGGGTRGDMPALVLHITAASRWPSRPPFRAFVAHCRPGIGHR
jgi:hypothetical protein